MAHHSSIDNGLLILSEDQVANAASEAARTLLNQGDRTNMSSRDVAVYTGVGGSGNRSESGLSTPVASSPNGSGHAPSPSFSPSLSDEQVSDDDSDVEDDRAPLARTLKSPQDNPGSHIKRVLADQAQLENAKRALAEFQQMHYEDSAKEWDKYLAEEISALRNSLTSRNTWGKSRRSCEVARTSPGSGWCTKKRGPRPRRRCTSRLWRCPWRNTI